MPTSSQNHKPSRRDELRDDLAHLLEMTAADLLRKWADLIAARDTRPGGATPRALPNTGDAEVLEEAANELLRVRLALLDLHPKVEDPKHGCCGRPKLCDGHPAECRSREHTIGGYPGWPCATLRAAGITSDEDADAVRRMAAALRDAQPGGEPNPAPLCRCGHGRGDHDAKYSDPQCRRCPEDGERMWRHAYTPVGGAR